MPNGGKQVRHTVSEELAKWGARVINECRNELSGAKIIYLFRSGNWVSKGRIVYGKAIKASEIVKTLTGADFIIVINQKVWENADEKMRLGLMDHELMHCQRGEDDKQGNATWHTDPHDTEEFYAVIRRRGLWEQNLRLLMKSIEDSKQMSITDLEAYQEPVDEEEEAEEAITSGKVVAFAAR